MEIRDNLKVKVLEAKKLVVVNGFPPTSFVELIVGDSRRQTREVPDSCNPKYSDVPIIFERILGSGSAALMAYIFHRDPTGGRNICIGVSIVSLESFFQSPKVALDYWYPVQPPPNSEEEARQLVDAALAEGAETQRNKLEGISETRIRLEIEYDNNVDDGIRMPAEEELIPPNLVQVQVLKAENLRSSFEAFVEVQIGSLRKITQTTKKTNAPTWNEQVNLPVSDGTDFLEITLKMTFLLRSKVIGRARVALNEIAAAGDRGIMKVLPLLGENYEFSTVPIGDISISAKWIYDQATENKAKRAAAAQSLFSAISRVFKSKPKASLDDKGDGKEGGAENPRALTQAQKQEELMRKLGINPDMSSVELALYLETQRDKRWDEIGKLIEEAQYAEELEMPEGDYTIQVQVIEVCDLVGLNASGLSDPLVVVECMGQTQRTRHVSEVNAALFDQTFYFNFTGLKRDQLLEASVKFSVYDHNWLRANESIGFYSVDIPSVYASLDHELYKRWATLRDPTNKEDTGSQGLLKYSIVCLGPGDIQRIHDPIAEADEEDERDTAVKEGAEPPDMEKNFAQSLNFLVISILKAEGLPGYDRLLSTIKTGLYVYVQVEFAGCKPMKTTKVAISGKKNLSAAFEEEIWLPVWIPSYCKRAAVSIMNREFGRRDQIIATTYIDFDRVPQYDRDPVVADSLFGSLGLANKKYEGAPLQWMHFYGANPLVRSGTKSAQFMNKYPNYASAYRGSLLGSIRVVKSPAAGFYSTPTEAAHKKTINYDIPDSLMPQGGLYVLKAMIYQGSDFGNTGTSGPGTNSSTKYSLGISIGHHEIRTAFRGYENGAVDWIELHDLKDIDLPREVKMLPDMFITVYKGSEQTHQSVSFTRLKPVDILPRTEDANDKIAKWYELRHDISHRSTNVHGYPGSVLLKLMLASIEDETAQQDWETYRRRLEIRKPFHLRVYVYQCRNLPAVDDNAMLDPYIKVRFAGEKLKTITQSNTRNPCYYQVLDFAHELPEELILAPNIVVQLWDGKNTGATAIAQLRHPVHKLEILTNVFSAEAPKPTWMDLYGIDGQKAIGQVLIAFQLFKKKDLKQQLPVPPNIVPTMKRAYLDIHTIGIRDLLVNAKGKSIVKKCSLHYKLFEGAQRTKAIVNASRSPTPANPNYLDRNIMPVNIPDDPLFSPTLELFVYDERALSTNLVAFCMIDLRTKLVWNAEEYIAPRHHEYIDETLKARKLVEEKMKKKAGKDAGKRVKKTKAEEAETVKKDDDEEAIEEVKKEDDVGVGVFPTDKLLHDAEGKPDHNLPTIKDREEFEAELARDRLVEDDMLRILGLKEEDPNAGKIVSKLNEMIKHRLGVPSAWTAADFMKGRDSWINSKKEGEGGDLEQWMQYRPFESYDLYQGHIAFNKLGKRRDTTRKVGLLKAVIRVTLNNPRTDSEYTQFKNKIRIVEPCKVRVYIIKAQNLQPLDGGWFGLPDPYLMVSLEGIDKKDMEHQQKATTDPEFYTYFEFDTKLPGPSLMKISLLDKKFLTGEQVLGETSLDLEDRWFHPKWSELEYKLIENRNLYKDGSKSAQGTVLMWVDILKKQDALKYEPTVIFGPEKLKFEIRVVCWRTKELKVRGKRVLDPYVTFYMAGDHDHRQSTDTHWRCRSAKASWNYRIKIPIELPIKSREHGRLVVQLWDRSFITTNEIIGETVVPLFNWLLLAYKRKTQPVVPFKERKVAEADVRNGIFDPPDESSTKLDEFDESQVLDDLDMEGADKTNKDDEGNNNGDGDATNGDDEVGDMEMGDTEPLLKKKDGDAAISKVVTTVTATPTAAEDKDAAKKVDDDEDEEKKDDDDDDGLGAFVSMIQLFLGWGDTIADDAKWLPITYHNHKKKRNEYCGSLAVSVTIVPESETISRPVGAGRDEPNSNPYLPPPVGRLTFSFNPLSLIWALFGPECVLICCCICCCLCCLAIFTFCSIYLSGIVSTIQLFEGNL